LESPHKIDINDWVIKGVKGELYPCKPDIFKITYEKEKSLSGDWEKVLDYFGTKIVKV